MSYKVALKTSSDIYKIELSQSLGDYEWSIVIIVLMIQSIFIEHFYVSNNKKCSLYIFVKISPKLYVKSIILIFSLQMRK